MPAGVKERVRAFHSWPDGDHLSAKSIKFAGGCVSKGREILKGIGPLFKTSWWFQPI